MQPPVILSALEQEYLFHIAEAAIEVRAAHDFFLWAQGQLQALLPHALMVALQCDADGAVLHSETVHAGLFEAALLARLRDAVQGLAHQCGGTALAPAAGEGAPAPLRDALAGSGFDHVLLHGTGPLAGGASVFALFGLPEAPGVRQAHFLALLLPHLHLALSRLTVAPPCRPAANPGARALSARETEILCWLREGKKNAEIGAILGISALTVKNHLQRIYPVLGARNRIEAVARSQALRRQAFLAQDTNKS